MFIRSIHLALAGTLGLTIPSHAVENWDQFRGPGEHGQAKAKGIATEWAEEKNVAWKTPLEGKAWSSPVIWADRIWVTNANAEGD